MISKKDTAMSTYRPTWAEIDLANLAFNYRRLKHHAGAATKMLAAVKANAYGHGMVEVSCVLERCGVDYFGVASVDEAIVLRKAGIRKSILVLGPVFSSEEARQARLLDLTLTVVDYRTAVMLQRQGANNALLKVHIKIDTGMGRLGIWHEEAAATVSAITRLAHLQVEGIYTHFASADNDGEFTGNQATIFKKLLVRLKEQGIAIPLSHAANSSALCRMPHLSFSMVRPGLMLYGMYPDQRMRKQIRLKPVLSLKTRIAFLKTVKAGCSISYGRTYVAKTKAHIATLPVGYADGYARALSNKAHVLVKGRRCPVVGRICMDQTMINAGTGKNIRVGDKVVLIGCQGNYCVRAEDLAQWGTTIPYEITCGISSRVPRVFKNTGSFIACEPSGVVIKYP
jgi:alanine racemase